MHKNDNFAQNPQKSIHCSNFVGNEQFWEYKPKFASDSERVW